MPAIHNYSYHPQPVFECRRNESVDTDLLIGAELEAEPKASASATFDRNATAQAVTDAAEGRIYCKADGSLPTGFEMVTHPATLAYHQYQFRWANIMRICTKAGMASHDTETCGLHFHVGRAGLGDTPAARKKTTANLVLLAYTLQDPLFVFSRRKRELLDRWAHFPTLDAIDLATASDRALVEMALATEDDGRYQAVNLQNSATVEFRIFRGTLKRDTLIASMQLVHSLCVYAMTHTPRECLSATIVDIINVNPYKELVAYCTSRGIIRTTIAAA